MGNPNAALIYLYLRLFRLRHPFIAEGSECVTREIDAKRGSNAHAADGGTPVAKTKGTESANLKDINGAGRQLFRARCGYCLD